VDQKVLLFLVILALVGIAYYVRFKPRHTRGAATTAETASHGSKPPRNEKCDSACAATSTSCTASCNFGDGACSHRCEQAKERCLAACR
jgi:hypothetical protein